VKAVQNYSLDVDILKAFNDVVPSQKRSKVVEGLLKEYVEEHHIK